MQTIEELWTGYKDFRKNAYPQRKSLYNHLSKGQSPKIALITCADSRLDPAELFGAAPGELFVVRNVANLVPPFESDGHYHGTSAALEFAVKQLRIRQIVVMGHAHCGGIAAALASGENKPVGQFIEKWVELIAPARQAVLAQHPDKSGDALEYELELQSIRLSLGNLVTFPFIREAVDAGQLHLHGAWFSIALGQLFWMQSQVGDFFPVE